MQRFFSEKRDIYGRVEVGATVSVFLTGTNTLATIYLASDPLDTPIFATANPFMTDANGQFSFAAPDGVYDITVVGTGSNLYIHNLTISSYNGGALPGDAVSKIALANNASNVQGAALVGYDSGLTYPVGTVGRGLANLSTAYIAADIAVTNNYIAADIVLSTATALVQTNLTNYQVNLADTSDVAKGDALVGVKSVLTGGAATTQHLKNWSSVSIVDFMTPAQWASWQADQAGYDMSTYLQAAINALTVGGEIYCPPGQYRLTSAINMTASSMAGRAVYGIRLFGAGDRATVFNLVHTGHGFDCTGAQFVNFEKFGVTGNAVTIPKTAFLFARNNTHNSAGQCRLSGVGVRGTFTVACLYNYAAEESRTTNCWFYNSRANTPAVVHTDDNITGVTSTFVTIDTGHQSNTEFRHIGTSIASDQPTGTAAALVLRGVSAFTFRDGFMAQTGSIVDSRYIDIDCTGTLNTGITIDNIMLDAGGSASVTYGILISGFAAACTKLTINQIMNYGVLPAGSGGYMLRALAGTNLTGMILTALPAGCAIKVSAVSDSTLILPREKLAIDTSASNNVIHIRNADLTGVITAPNFINNSVTFTDYGATTPNLRSGAGSPYTVVTPLFFGEQYVDTSTYTGNTCTATIWTATGLTSGYWVPTTGILCRGVVPPNTVVTPGYKGQEYLDDNLNKWWKSYGTLNNQWGQITN